MNKRHSIVHKFLLYSVLAIYAVLLCAILFRTHHTVRSVNLVPFRSIFNYLSGRDVILHSFALSNVLGNIVIFIPLGVYLTLFNRDKRVYKNVLWVFCISLLVEILQYLFQMGIGDIDDVILNCVGGFLGIAAYRGLLFKFHDATRVRHIIGIIAPFGGIASFLILYLYNTV